MIQSSPAGESQKPETNPTQEVGDQGYLARFDIPDRREKLRVSVSAALSVAVNVLFLVGAGNLVTPVPDAAPPDQAIQISIVDPATPAPIATPTPAPTPPPKEVKPTPAPAPPPIESKPTPPPIVRPHPEPPVIAPRPHHAEPPPTTAPPLVMAARSTSKDDDNSFVVAKGKAGSNGTDVNAAAGNQMAGAVPGGTGTTPGGTGGTEHVESAPKPPTPEPPAPTPTPPPPPKPVGPTRDAEADSQVNPEIPDELKNSDFKTYVRVEVDVDADGSFTPVLKTSSGNTQIDRLVLAALRRWHWKPALKDGDPIASSERFKFEFEVQ